MIFVKSLQYIAVAYASLLPAGTCKVAEYTSLKVFEKTVGGVGFNEVIEVRPVQPLNVLNIDNQQLTS